MIRVRGLTHHYKTGTLDAPVLRDLDLDIASGELVAIKGSSGSGKSTLLYVLGCLLRPDHGTVEIDGFDVSKLTDRAAAELRNRKLGFVFQQFHLLARATVLENILLPSLYPVESSRNLAETESLRERAKKLADELGLTSHLNHLPNQLSGGQQQRVAIARALLAGAPLLLADEPTGNLDSKNAEATLELLKQLNREGKTVVIVTHDQAVADQCNRVIELKDGEIISDKQNETVRAATKSPANRTDSKYGTETETETATLHVPDGKLHDLSAYAKISKRLTPLALNNLNRSRGRSALTMLGIVIGIAAVLAMVTIGQFTKRRILESYEALGVNLMMIRGYPNWNLRAVDKVNLPFKAFDWRKDLEPLKRIFGDINYMSPVMNTWNNGVDFGGRSLTQGIRVLGVNHEYLTITNRILAMGMSFSPYHVENRSPVCIIGSEIASQLFRTVNPLGQIAFVTAGQKGAFGCKVIGVLKPQSSKDEWNKPNLHLLVPYSYFMTVTDSWWDAQIHEVTLQASPGTDVELRGRSIRAFFEKKYGQSGRFYADSDATLIAQMKRFLSIFTMMLASIALLSLVVGGIGITNMMLVSVSERFKEIGLRKALGATELSIRVQFLLESVILCLAAGLLGLALGFAAYETMIYGASKFVPKVAFEWVVEPGALILSLASIMVVGVASGLLPALKAEKLEVIEALRSE